MFREDVAGPYAGFVFASIRSRKGTAAMPNFAAALKQEITRLARKEVKAHIATTKRAAVQHRREIAMLKRQIRLQDRRIASMQIQATQAAGAKSPTETAEPRRFSIRSVKAQRRRLKLSAAQFGKLIGVTAQAIYNWEQGKARPRKSQFEALVAIRTIGRREALKRLA
jgi:DNA-binding transcriptional regulator YiaG